MQQSTTTLLQAVNEILTLGGERPVQGISSFPAIKAKLALETALQEITTTNDWAFNKVSTPAVSWANDIATLPTMHRLLGVTSITGGNATPLQPQTREDYPWYNAQPGSPQFFTLVDVNQVAVQPYPADAEARQRIIFHYVQSLLPPIAPTDTYPLPERMMRVLIQGAMKHFAITHLDDAGLSAAYGRNYDSMMFGLVRREPGVAIGSKSMYKRR